MEAFYTHDDIQHRTQKQGRAARLKALPAELGVSSRVVCCQVTAIRGEHYRLSNGMKANQALSCLIRPNTGDLVCVLLDNKQGNFILSILSRTESNQVDVELPGVKKLTMKIPVMDFIATESLGFVSFKNIELSAPFGKMTLSAKNMLSCAQESIVDVAKNYFANVSHYGVKALELLHLHGRQQMIIAEKDIRLDGEHINMG